MPSDTPTPAGAPGPGEQAEAGKAAAAAPPDPMSVRVMKNIDIPVLALALVIFVVAGFPILGWVTAAAAWAVQRGIAAWATNRAMKSEDPRTKVGLLAGSMIARGWIVAGIIIAVGLGHNDAGLAAAVLFLITFTAQFTMTLVLRPFELAPKRPAK